MKRNRALILGCTAAVVLPLLVCTASVVQFSKSDRICNGVTVSGISVGGLSKTAAGDTLRGWAKDRMAREIVLTALDTRWSGTLAGFGTRIDWQKAVDQAYAIGRDGNLISRAVSVMGSGGMGKHIQAPIIVNPDTLEKTLSKVSRAVNRPHKDATLKVVDDRFQVEPDSCGIKLDEKQAIKIVLDAVRDGKQLAPLPVVVDKPDVTADDARKVDTLLARYITPFNPSNRPRTHNLSLAAKSINGVVLTPDSEFSYNDTVGPRIAERGYQNAIVFVRGKMEDGIGGGICQVSSTLYNSVLLAGLDITARRPHSRTVPYVTPGRDATVAYGHQDFRFRNSNSSPIAIISSIKGAHLTIDIYGSAPDRKTVEIYTSKPKYVPHGQETITDATLAAGVRKVVDKGSTGVSVVVYRRVSHPDGRSSTEVLSRDKYPAQARVVAVGSKRVSSAQKPGDQKAVSDTRT